VGNRNAIVRQGLVLVVVVVSAHDHLGAGVVEGPLPDRPHFRVVAVLTGGEEGLVEVDTGCSGRGSAPRYPRVRQSPPGPTCSTDSADDA
jgi:hypothetical protein